MDDETPTARNWNIGVKLVLLVVAQAFFFAPLWLEADRSVQDIVAWLYFVLSGFCNLFLQYISPAANSRYAGAILGVLVALGILVLPTRIADGPALLVAVLPPLLGQLVWVLYNQLPAVRRAREQRDAAEKEGKAALMSAGARMPAKTETAAEAEAGGEPDAPIDVAGLAHTLDDIRGKK